MGMQKIIFVVDDNDTNLAMAEEALEDSYSVMTLPSALKMFALLEKITPDLILMDIEMPEMDGFQALQKLKASPIYADIPVVFLTSMTDAAVEVRGFQLGVVDFITKPFSAPVLINRIRTHLDIDMLIRERTKQLQQLQNAIVFGFADIIESRDHDTGGHVDRTSEYIRALVRGMITRGVYFDEMSKMNLESLISSARLHDVGKITITDAILNKPAKLTSEEFNVMQTHTTEGEKIIDHITLRTSNADFLHNARLFAGTHHERWDGTGYPQGRKGTDIPLQGRLMAIADVYDALVSERPYKGTFSSEEATRIIMENSGSQFDPEIAQVFFEVQDQFNEIRLKDSHRTQAV